MKHKLQRPPETPWTIEKVQHQIEQVEGHIQQMNRHLNFFRDKEREIYQMQIEMRMKLSNKQKYLNQLRDQLEELKSTNDEHR